MADRVEALRAFLDAVADHLPETLLTPARLVLDRAGQRLSLSQQHTVVALAGASGSGKSSLFNTLAKLELSEVGSRRPTTAVAHACVWVTGRDAQLLDWLGIPPSQRFTRESPLDADDEAALRGLVLLDLPDFDSVEDQHRIEVDRLLTMVDLVVWVLDPQKYADHVVHRRYLSRFHRHADIAVVLLNQADRLRLADRNRCLADLRRLLDTDGLGGVPVLATSAVGSPGTAELRSIIEGTVAARKAAQRRLASDLDAAVADLAPVVGPAVAEGPISRDMVDALADALVAVAQVPTLVQAAVREYRSQAVRGMRWPAPTLRRRTGPRPDRPAPIPSGSDPTGRDSTGPNPTGLNPTGNEGVGPGRRAVPGEPAALPGGPDISGETVNPEGTVLDLRGSRARPALVAMAARVIGEGAGAGLPMPWPAATAAAARSHLDDLQDALEAALSSPGLAPGPASRWWRLVGLARWACVLVAAVGLATRVTELIVGGLAGVLLITMVAWIALRIAGGRVRDGYSERLREAVTRVGRELVEAPVRAVLRSYTEAQVALTEAT